MNLREFLDNPIGKGDASVNVRMIREALSIKYDKYIKTKKIELKVYRQPLKDIYWIWLVMPTETERDNSYDVVFTFTNPKSTDRTALGIGKFDIQMFANTPSFAYTYAYVYNKNGLLIPSLTSKLGKIFISKSPNVRNRNQIVLFDKYIYFGARYILDSKVLNRAVADVRSKKYDQLHFNSNIRTLKAIMEEYNDAEEKLRIKKRKGKVNEEKGKTKRNSERGSINRVTGAKANIKGTSKDSKRTTSVKKTKSTIKKK